MRFLLRICGHGRGWELSRCHHLIHLSHRSRKLLLSTTQSVRVLILLLLQILLLILMPLIEKVRLVIDGLGLLLGWGQVVGLLAEIAVHNGGAGGFTPTAAGVIKDLML